MIITRLSNNPELKKFIQDESNIHHKEFDTVINLLILLESVESVEDINRLKIELNQVFGYSQSDIQETIYR